MRFSTARRLRVRTYRHVEALLRFGILEGSEHEPLLLLLRVEGKVPRRMSPWRSSLFRRSFH